jgi:excisionase family DNA binding protein
MSDQREKLTVRQAAERAGVSIKTVRRRIDGGELAAYSPKGVRKVIVFADDVERVFALEPVTPRPRPRPVTPLESRRPAASGSRDALRAIERGAR